LVVGAAGGWLKERRCVVAGDGEEKMRVRLCRGEMGLMVPVVVVSWRLGIKKMG
jgi:hypothetical protein